MKKKLIIEIIIYTIIIIVGIILLFTYKPYEKEIVIPTFSQMEIKGVKSNAFIYF